MRARSGYSISWRSNNCNNFIASLHTTDIAFESHTKINYTRVEVVEELREEHNWSQKSILH